MNGRPDLRARAWAREVLVVASMVLVGCTHPRPAATGSSDPAARAATIAWTAPLDRDHPLVGRIWDVRRGAFVTEASLENALASSSLAGVGEQHDNADHHLLQARLLASWVARGRSPGVVFEMLDREDQAAVDRARAEHPADPDAIGDAAHWEKSGWPPWALYRPVFATAVEARLPVVAAGVPRRAAMRIAMEGPAESDPHLAAYGVDDPLPGELADSLRAEMRDAHCGLLPAEMLDGMMHVQRVRDATLADGLAGVADRGGLLIAGNGHVRNDRGAPAAYRRAHPDAALLSIGLLEVRPGLRNPRDYGAEFGVDSLPFDYVWFTPRASDEDHCKEIRVHHPDTGRKPDDQRAPDRSTP